MKKGMIVSGGTIHREFAGSFLEEWMGEENANVLIAADRGLVFLEEQGVKPTHVVGDFDSCTDGRWEKYERDPEVEFHRFRPEKDLTDTQIALELAMELGCDEITMLGCTGSRLDHVYANVLLLKMASERGVRARIIDRTNRISLYEGPFRKTLKKEEAFGTYLSLFSFCEDVEGLCAEGVKYPLHEFTLKKENPLGVSNELTEETACLSFDKGCLILMESRD